ncbi:MAG: S24 family peptidase [Reyranellaceae bacterium]
MKNYDAEKRRTALRRLMKERGLSVNGWAKAAGLSEGGLRDFLSGKSSSLTDRTYVKLANAVSLPASVLRGDEAAPTELPLWGYAGAGEIVHPFDGDDPPPLETVEAPPGLKNGAAVIVRGDSMLPRMQDGDVIFFELRELPPERLLNEECVVRLAASAGAQGPILVKKLTRGTKKNRYHLVSVNPAVPPMEDQAVAWAAAIMWIRRRQPKR